MLRLSALLSILCLAGCAGLWPEAQPPLATRIDAPVAAQWQAPLPHGGQVGKLARWWRQFNDPLLEQLIEASQQASPSLSAARSRIEQARANLLASGAALPPLGRSVPFAGWSNGPAATANQTTSP